MRVADILQSKGSRVLTIDPDKMVLEAARALRNAGVGALVVSRDGRTIDGILSERDIVRGLAQSGVDISHLHVSDLMTSGVVTVASGDTLADVAAVMNRKRIRHLPVIDGGRLVGIVSIGDVLKNRIDEVVLEANVLRDVAVAFR